MLPRLSRDSTVRTRVVLIWSRRGVVASFLFFALAMALYPGGTLFDRDSSGYSFFKNFGSDPGRLVAHNGAPNARSVVVAAIGAISLAFGLICGVAGFIQVYSRSRATRWLARGAGTAVAFSCLSLLTASVLPSDRHLDAHLSLSMWAFNAAPLAGLLFAGATFRNERLSRGVPVLWLVLALVLGAFLFMRFPIDSDAGLIAQATAQKAVFMVIAAVFVYQSRQAEAVLTAIGRRAEV